MKNIHQKIIVGNWKMHKTLLEARSFMAELLPLLAGGCSSRVWIAPPFPLILPMIEWADRSVIEIGAQNIHDQEQGAFTGETSAKLLKELGAKFALIGHSERRHLFQEQSPFLLRKVERALSLDLTPVFCIGETIEERNRGLTQQVLKKQLFEGLSSLSSQDMLKIVVAYEPVWAIGTGEHATVEIVEEAHLFCRSVIRSRWGEPVAEQIPILYGGSVNSDNAKQLLSKHNVNGVLVGGASLSAETFLQIIRAT